MKVEVYLNPSALKVPARLRYKALATPPWPVTSTRELGIGYGATKAAAKQRAIADYQKRFGGKKRAKPRGKPRGRKR